jgi:hypothetical protein
MKEVLPLDRIQAIQEQHKGFMNKEIIYKDGEFYYDGGKLFCPQHKTKAIHIENIE